MKAPHLPHIVHWRRPLIAAAATAALIGGTIAAVGAGAASLNVDFTASSVDFGSVTIATSQAEQVVVTNGSTVDLYLKSATVIGGNAGDFTSSAATCSAAVAPGDTCNIGVTFTPTAPGVRTTDLAVIMGAKNSNGDFIATALVQSNLTGVGLKPSVALTNADAGSVAVNSTGIATATLTNNSLVAVSLDSTSLAGVVHNDFRVTATTCQAPVQSGQSCAIVVAFSPAATGSVTATLTAHLSITGTSSDFSAQSTISGTGTSSGSAPAAEVSSLNFGQVSVGLSATGEAALVNTSASAEVVKGLATSGRWYKQFAVTGNNCGTSLASGASCQITVTYTPATATVVNATLAANVQYTADGHTETAHFLGSLAGQGVKPTVALAPPSFGSVTIGADETEGVLITNTSLVALKWDGATLPGPHLPSWKKSGSTCAGSPLAAGASCDIELTFTPHTAGDLTTVIDAALSITVHGHTVHVYGQANVHGTGVEPTFTFAVPSLGPTKKNTPVTGTATITNTSDVTLSYSAVHFNGGAAADFSVTANSCSAPLQPSQGCTVTVSFDPKQSGSGTRTSAATAVVTVDGISPTHTVASTEAISGVES